jgi:HD-GYP domain-containing protein (c-di-GMP phosphodiesterase class II)
MVLCQELTAEEYGGSVPEVDLERKFYGFWTFEPELVLEAAELTIAHTGIYNADLSQQLREKAAAIATQTQQALTQQLTADHLGETVARVVEYLQTNQQEMQSHQALDKNLTSNELQAFLRVAQLIDQNDLSNPMAAAEVASLAEAMGQLVDLPSWQLHRLRLAGLLHRVALLQKSETVLNTNPTLAGYGTEVATVPLSCPLLPGVQVLRKMGRLKAIATILTHQSECWNGSGQPANLVGDQIPVESRILGLVACFQQRVMQHHADAPDQPINYAMTAALTQCQAEGGDRWDPKLLDVLELLVKGLQQGMSLPIALPKIAAGLWLLDSHSEEEILSYQDAI